MAKRKSDALKAMLDARRDFEEDDDAPEAISTNILRPKNLCAVVGCHKNATTNLNKPGDQFCRGCKILAREGKVIKVRDGGKDCQGNYIWVKVDEIKSQESSENHEK